MRRTFHKAPCIIAGLLKTALLPTRRANLHYRKCPVSLNKDQVQHIAMLARLKLDEGEYAESVEKLSKIVDFVDQLSQADTAGVVPMAHPLDAAQRLRPDVITEDDQRAYYQQNAAAVSDGLYLVPKVIE